MKLLLVVLLAVPIFVQVAAQPEQPDWVKPCANRFKLLGDQINLAIERISLAKFENLNDCSSAACRKYVRQEPNVRARVAAIVAKAEERGRMKGCMESLRHEPTTIDLKRGIGHELYEAKMRANFSSANSNGLARQIYELLVDQLDLAWNEVFG